MGDKIIDKFAAHSKPIRMGLNARRAFRDWRTHRRAIKARRESGEVVTTEEAMFPKGTMTKSGIIMMAVGGVLAMALPALGVGECTPEQLVEGCVGASVIKESLVNGIGLLVTAVGGIIGWRGKNRADAGHPGL